MNPTSKKLGLLYPPFKSTIPFNFFQFLSIPFNSIDPNTKTAPSLKFRQDSPKETSAQRLLRFGAGAMTSHVWIHQLGC